MPDPSVLIKIKDDRGELVMYDCPKHGTIERAIRFGHVLACEYCVGDFLARQARVATLFQDAEEQSE